jgi:hypothetical protein
MTDHPITPPPELVEQWVQATESNDCIGAFPTNFEKRICTAAARWGADQELEACCDWLKEGWDEIRADKLRAARRPKPPSLKEQALLAIDTAVADGRLSSDVSNVVRRALEQLDD